MRGRKSREDEFIVTVPVRKSSKLDHILYDIRGPITDRARQLERAGHQITKLNIGNMAPFGFEAPETVRREMHRLLDASAGYSDSKGVEVARQAVARRYGDMGVADVSAEDVFLGNGASELIALATNALLDNGDEMLVPMPDYPLWTACTTLAGGTAVQYRCDEATGWMPDLDHIRSKITPRTRGLVIINPNNPTGAVYPQPLLLELVQIARDHGLVIFSDEVYDRMLYEGARHTAIASLSSDVLTLTFNSLSKSYRSCGYRAGWLVVSGDTASAHDYIDGLNMLSSMRLCPNVPGQWAVAAALEGAQDIRELVGVGGRLRRQRDIAHELLTAIPGVSCRKPDAALYLFPRLDAAMYPISDDRAFFLQLLNETHVLLVQGSGFNYPGNQHFRIVFLPHEDELRNAIGRVAAFLERYRDSASSRKSGIWRAAVPV